MGEIVQLFAIGTLKHNSTAGDGKNTHKLLQSILYSQISNQDNSTLWLGAMFEGSSYAYWWAMCPVARCGSTSNQTNQPLSQVLWQLFLGEDFRNKQLL